MAEDGVIEPFVVLLLLSVTDVLLKEEPGDVIGSPAASATVTVPVQVAALQISPVIVTLAATPFSVKGVESAPLFPGWIAYVALFSAKTVVPLSISTAKL
jgi:hypothetical protein